MNKAIAMLCVVLLLLSGVLGVPGQLSANENAIRTADKEMSIRAVAAPSHLIGEQSIAELIDKADIKPAGIYKVYSVSGQSAKKLFQIFKAQVVFFPQDKVILVLEDQEA